MKPFGFGLNSRRHAWLTMPVFSAILVCLTAINATAVQINLDPPGEREFVRDLASMIEPGDANAIQAACEALLTEKATPILVVTVGSMAEHGGAGIRIETFARLLFDQWGIGHATLGDQTWNTGILLLVSRDDRKARIELGAGWGREKDDLCTQIMEEQIISQFREGRFSAGIAAGVVALDKMARGLELPRRPVPWWHYALTAGAVALAIFTIVSMIRRGASGWAWLFWGAVFAGVGYLLYSMLSNSGGRSSGGFGGGSFGGGFSGGGGATGSW